MATVNWNVSKDARVALTGSTSLGAGKNTTLPVGTYSGYQYRSLLGFSYSFSGMTAITSAILHIKTSSQVKVAFGSSPNIHVYRLTATWSEGTVSDPMTGSNAVEWSNQPAHTTTNGVGKAVTTSENTFITVDITAMIQDAFAAGVFQGIKLIADTTASSDVTEFWSREQGSSDDAYIVVTYSTNTAPNAPTSLSPTADAVTSSLTPTLTGTFSDPDSGDHMTSAQVIVYADDGTTVKWDSGVFVAAGATFSKLYGGAALTGNTFYKWKARTADGSAVWGPYSSLQRFKANSAPNAPTVSLLQTPTSDIKTLTPTFNITHSDPDPSDSSMYGYHIILETSAGAAVWDSGDLSTAATVSKAHLYAGPALSWQTAYRWRARTKDSNGVWGAYSANQTFTTHTTGTPIGLNPTGGAGASSITPTLTGSRASSADTLTSAQIQVYAADGITLIWDSAAFSSGVTSSTFSKIYSGTALSSLTTYKWRARVTGSIGGTSAWSAVQSFVTPDTSVPNLTAPVGTGITPATNTVFTITRSTNFNRHEIRVYSDAAGTVSVTSDTPAAYSATGTKSFTYTGTLSWNTTYYWKARVSADGGSTWSSYSGLVAFTTDAAGVGTGFIPSDHAWLGAPQVIDEFDDNTGITNGTSASATLETSIFQTGLGALKVAITTLALSTASYTYRTLASALDLSDYGASTPLYIYAHYSSSTNVASMRLRFEFATSADYAEFDIQPSTINTWEQKSLVLGTPTATGGTVNWANVTKIGLRLVASGGGSVTTNVYLDDLKIDGTAPSFDGVTSGGDTLSAFRVRVYASNQTTLVWDSGDISGSGTTFSTLYAGSALTKGAQYYWQARYTKSSGPVGDYSAMQGFILNSDPSVPTSLVPASGGIVGDSTTPHFIAMFNDSEKSSFADYPTYMEVEVYRNSDSVLAYSLLTKTGLVAATNEIYDGLSGTVKTTGAAAPIVYETTYKYRVRYYDSKGSRGTWSSYTTFKPTQSPVVTITFPTDGGTLASPSFNVTWSMSSAGGKGQNSYQVRVIRSTDDFEVINTAQVFSSATTYTVPSGFLVNGFHYDIEVTVWDTDGLASTPDTNNALADWAGPDAIQDFTVTDDVSLSAIVLSWTASNLLPADFREYVIYRKLSSSTEWAVLTTIADESTTTYNDFTAANTVSYDYKITQMEIIIGDVDLESDDSDIGTSSLDTDSWYFIGVDKAENHIFELPVTAAPFTEPVQQEVFEPLGTSRKVIIRGRVMGAEGSLTLSWSTDERELALIQLAYMKGNPGPHVLKSPFGDSWEVQFGAPSKEYVAGGHFNATITWTEIA